jgi:hypothetical protein
MKENFKSDYDNTLNFSELEEKPKIAVVDFCLQEDMDFDVRDKKLPSTSKSYLYKPKGRTVNSYYHAVRKSGKIANLG